MAETLEAALERVQSEIAGLNKLLRNKKVKANMLCELMDQAALYSDADLDDAPELSPITRDAYYGQDIADVIEDILRRRKVAGKSAATVNEIFDSMRAGGYNFKASNDDNAKRGLYISLGKNPKFHKLPDGSYGLSVWYPAIKESKPKNGNADKDAAPAPAEDLLGDLFDFEVKESAAEGEATTPPVTPEVKKKGTAPKSPAQAARAAADVEDI